MLEEKQLVIEMRKKVKYEKKKVKLEYKKLKQEQKTIVFQVAEGHEFMGNAATATDVSDLAQYIDTEW